MGEARRALTHTERNIGILLCVLIAVLSDLYTNLP